MNTFEQLEQMRRKARNAQIVAVALLVIGFILFLPMPPLGFVLFVCGIIGMAVARHVAKPYKNAYKELLVKDLLSQKFDDLRFYPDRGIEKETVESTDMMQMGNRYHANDLIEGSYNGVRFSQSDILIQHHTSNGKSSHTTTYLQGRWLIFDFNKRFLCDLQVRDKAFTYAKKSGGWFSDRDQTHRLKTESVAFNDQFTVYAEDDSEAYYILTPHFMEALTSLKARNQGELLFCFVDSKLHVAVNSGEDSFEPSIWHPIDRAEATRAISKDIQLITDLVDTLSLDNRLFKEYQN